MTTEQEIALPDMEECADECDIYIVGLGIKSVWQLTKEVDAILRKSSEILYVELSQPLHAYMSTFCDRVTDLRKLAYRENVDRLNAYDTMTALVVNAAMAHPPVSFALYGHPLVFALPPFQILQIAPLLGLRVKVLPGISALDCLIADLKFDPATNGLQMYEASDVLLRNRPLQPDVPCILWQIGAVETSLFSSAISRPERFTRIKNYLLKFYPREHKVTAVFSSPSARTSSTVFSFAIDEMEREAARLHQSVTLYIPPVNLRPIADRDLLNAMVSESHLAAITRSAEIDSGPLFEGSVSAEPQSAGSPAHHGPA